MSKTLTIRLTDEQAAWLEQAARRTGLPQGRIVRDQIERVRESGNLPSFMRLAGTASGAANLSTRKGFSLK
jgi:predicted DNA-binding ribbon-helix-helix protein